LSPEAESIDRPISHTQLTRAKRIAKQEKFKGTCVDPYAYEEVSCLDVYYPHDYTKDECYEWIERASEDEPPRTSREHLRQMVQAKYCCLNHQSLFHRKQTLKPGLEKTSKTQFFHQTGMKEVRGNKNQNPAGKGAFPRPWGISRNAKSQNRINPKVNGKLFRKSVF